MRASYLLQPEGGAAAFKQRKQRVFQLAPYRNYEISEFLAVDAVMDTFDGTQFDGENHRRQTPMLQDLLMFQREETMQNLDRRVGSNMLIDAINKAERPRPMVWDAIVIGSGPHGVALLAHLREKYPKLKTLLVDGGERLGGQFRSYGDKPVFAMNSRNRRADRRLPSLPRTPGNINSLGRFAPLELSDFVQTMYPMNTDIGDASAINAFLSADDIMIDTKVLSIGRDSQFENAFRVVRVQRGDDVIELRGKRVIDATGLPQGSALKNGNTLGEGVVGSPNYMTPTDFYKHFAESEKPMEMFAKRDVAVIGRGDSALTVLEALGGMLPASTYGTAMMARNRPRNITWIGAPAINCVEIADSLRARYKNGIVQSIARPGDDTDGLGVIRPNTGFVYGIERNGDLFSINTEAGRNPQAAIVVDCTSYAREIKQVQSGWEVDGFVGPNNGALSQDVRQTIQRLGVNENNVALWATMPSTDGVAERIGRQLTV